MYVGTLNIKDNPDIAREKVVKCAQILRRNCVIAGLQEIREGEDVEDVMAGLGFGWDIVNESSPNPIVWDTSKFRIANPSELPPGFQPRGLHTFHKGDARVPTPTRLESWAVFKSLQKPKLPPFVWSNGHLINKAWNGRERNRSIEIYRRHLWNEGFDEWQWSINNFRRAGLTTIWSGDFNRRLSGIPLFTPAQQTVASHGIDNIFIAQGRGPGTVYFKVHSGRSKAINTPSDHPLVLGNLDLLLP